MPTIDYTGVLDSFGTRFIPEAGFAIFTDVAKAESAYIHHTAVPTAVTTFATISPIFARGRFPGLTLADVVLKRPFMDCREVAALAAVCGEIVPPSTDAEDFLAHLLSVIERHDMGMFFGRYPEHAALHGIDVRPRGVDWTTYDVDEEAIHAWRKAYRKLAPPIQMLVATVMWLYSDRPDCRWLERVPHRWHAAEAVNALKESGSLADWGRLVALYRGW
jgi:hypothetical protein